MKSIEIQFVPVSDYQDGFTTNSTLHVIKISSRLSHKFVLSPHPAYRGPEFTSPTVAWEAFYPKGSINPSASIPGGFGFYLLGAEAFIKSLESGATEAVLSYRMMLQEGWEWVKGGKLPGICED